MPLSDASDAAVLAGLPEHAPPLRILILSQYFWPEEFRVNDLALELQRRGHHVTVLTGQPNYPSGTIPPEFKADPARFGTYHGMTVHRVPIVPRGKGSLRLMVNYASFVVSGLLLAPWKLRGQAFDAIFVFQTSPITSVIPALLLRVTKRAPVLLWVLDLWPETLAAVGVVRSPRVLGWVGALVRFIYKRCDRVLVQSRAFGANVKRWGGTDAQLRFFPNWAEPIFKGGADDAQVAPEVAAFDDTFNVMFAGNLGEAQDFPSILDAAERLRDSEPRLRWLIVGDGRVKPWVEAEIARRGLAQRVVLLGRHPTHRMPEFFRRAHVALVTLRAEPVFSMTVPGKVQSYMAAGLPIVGMLDGEGGALIRDAGCGLAVDAGDSEGLARSVRAMMALPPADLQRMGEKGRALCDAEFDQQRVVSNLEVWMRELARAR